MMGECEVSVGGLRAAMRGAEANGASHEPSEAPQGFGVRQSSGAFDWRTRIPIAPEDWRTPRRWRDNESANQFMAPMRAHPLEVEVLQAARPHGGSTGDVRLRWFRAVRFSGSASPRQCA